MYACQPDTVIILHFQPNFKSFFNFRRLVQFTNAGIPPKPKGLGFLPVNMVIEAAGNAVGFYSLERIFAAEVELSLLFVEPDFIGKGYGRKLMMHAQGEARHLGYSKMIIQGDPNAERFYRSAGGSVVGTRKSASIPNRELPIFCINLTELDESPLG